MSASLYSQLSFDRPDKQIRLLRLEPPSPDHDDHVFSLAVHNFDESNRPTYVAISYTWGLPVPSLPIVVNGHKIKVQLNCWYALWQMRHHGYTNQNLWIDSLCINQSDNEEKSGQVRMMGTIYSSADWVASCIGTGDGTGSLRKIEPANFSEVGEKVDQLPYFERVWIKQEVILARDVRMFSGADILLSAEFTQLSKAAAYMRNNETPRVYPDNFNPKESEITQAHSKRTSRRQRNFVDLALQFKTAKATDPKDKIYALLPLLPEDDILRRELHPVYGEGAFFSLLRNFARLLYSGYKDVEVGSKHQVLEVVVKWLIKGLEEEIPSHAYLRVLMCDPRPKENDPFSEIKIDDLRLIHEDAAYDQLSRSSFRVEGIASTTSKTAKNTNFLAYERPLTKQPRCFASLMPLGLETMKVLYNYSNDGESPDLTGRRTIFFYVNTDVRPGDVVAVVSWNMYSPEIDPYLARFSTPHAHAILRPMGLDEKETSEESLPLPQDFTGPSRQSVYVFHSWAVPASLRPKMLYSDDGDSSFNRKTYPMAKTFSCSEVKGKLLMHYNDILTVSLTMDNPLRSLLYSSTKDTFGFTSGTCFFQEADEASDRRGIAVLLEKEKEYIQQELELKLAEDSTKHAKTGQEAKSGRRQRRQRR